LDHSQKVQVPVQQIAEYVIHETMLQERIHAVR